jgi:HK97 family phage portal protein
MGFLDNFTLRAPAPTNVVDAASVPVNNPDTFYLTPLYTVDRNTAMSVPSIARARNIICGIVASLPLEQYNKLTGAHIEPLRVINQPDQRVPGSYVRVWQAEDLLFYGVSYAVVNAIYSDGRVADYTRVEPSRVTPRYNADSTEIIALQLDGKIAPASGVGSIITFYGMDEGLLSRAGRTIRAAIALERAAENFAQSPVPTMALKSNGTNLTAERITKLLSSWNQSRKTNSTAFLNADIDLQVLGIDPSKLQLNEARQYVSLELARATGIPAYFLSSETTSMTYTNAVSERKALIDFSVRNILTPIEQRLSMPDFATLNTETRFDLDDFLRGSALERAQVYQILNQIGAMSVEQIQEEEDLIR